MRASIFAFALGVTAVAAMAVSPLSHVPALAESRTGSELGLFLLLNGERVRTVQADGGGLTLFTSDAGIASVTVPGGGVVYIENPGTTACHLCSPSDSAWDGGCNTTVGDPNYGSPIAASGGQRWVSLRDSTTTLRAVPASGSAGCSMPVFNMR